MTCFSGRMLCALISTGLPVAALADGTSGVFVDIAAGRGTHGQYWHDSAAAQVSIGYRWHGLGVEASQLRDARARDAINYGPPYGRMHVHGYGAGANGRWTLASSGWYVSARSGVLSWKVDLTDDVEPVNPVDPNPHRAGTSWYAGVGAGYDITRHFGIGLAYDRYPIDYGGIVGHNANKAVLSVLGELRF